MGFLWFGKRSATPATAKGSRTTVTKDDLELIRELKREGSSLRDIAAETGLALNTVSKYAKSRPEDRLMSELEDWDHISTYIGAMQKKLSRFGSTQKGGLEGALTEHIGDLKVPLLVASLSLAARSGIDPSMVMGFVSMVTGASVPAPQLAGPVPVSDPRSSNWAHPAEPAQGDVAAYLIAQFGERSPEEAARWLLEGAQQDATARQFAQALAGTPDEKLGELLAGAEATTPPLRGLGAWLTPRWDWLLQTVAELRRLAPA